MHTQDRAALQHAVLIRTLLRVKGRVSPRQRALTRTVPDELRGLREEGSEDRAGGCPPLTTPETSMVC